MQLPINQVRGLKLLYLDKIRIANPSVWNGLTENNEKVYAEFFCGELSVGIGKSFAEAKKLQNLVIDYGEDLDYLSTEDLIRTLKWKIVVVEPKFSTKDCE